MNDLDSSNVLYDEDFEINEEEKVDSSRDVQYHDNAPASTLFSNNDWELEFQEDRPAT